jgi:hypothetical protein
MDFYFCNLTGVHPITALIQHEKDLIEREKMRPNWLLIVRYKSSIVMFIVHSYDTLGQVVEMGSRTRE